MKCSSKDWDVTEHAKCLQLILTWGLTIGIWCCLSDHAPLTPINSHVNKRHQYLANRPLSVLPQLLHWSLHSNFNSSISYKRSRMLEALTLAEGFWWAKELNLFCWCLAAATAPIGWNGHQKESVVIPRKAEVDIFAKAKFLFIIRDLGNAQWPKLLAAQTMQDVAHGPRWVMKTRAGLPLINLKWGKRKLSLFCALGE